MNDPRYLHTEEKQEGETFFDVMNRLIARSKGGHGGYGGGPCGAGK